MESLHQTPAAGAIHRPVQAPIGRSRLVDLIKPLTLDRFLREHFAQRPLYVAGRTGRFHRLLDWNGLARLLESHPLDDARMRLVMHGKDLPSDRYRQVQGGIGRLDTGRLSLLLDSGATLVINHIDDLVPEIARLADDIGDRLDARTVVNLYASWRADPGFGPHWDHHDIFALQLAGRKQWPVYRPVCPNPLQGGFHCLDKGAQPEREDVLEDGDVLYLPRGWIHSPTPLGEPSLHLTVSVTRPKGSSFLEWLVKELQSDPEVRANIPFTDDRKSWNRWKKRLAAIVSEAIEGCAAERYVAHKDAARGARPQLSFPEFGRLDPAAWTDSTVLRPASLHRIMVTQKSDGASEIEALGKSWPCSAAVAAAIQRLTSTRPLTLKSICDGLPAREAAELRVQLARLATIGLLSAAAGSTGRG